MHFFGRKEHALLLKCFYKLSLCGRQGGPSPFLLSSSVRSSSERRLWWYWLYGSSIHSPDPQHMERTSIHKRKGEGKGKEGEGEGKEKGNGGVIVTKCAGSSFLDKSPSQQSPSQSRLLFGFENNLREKQSLSRR